MKPTKIVAIPQLWRDASTALSIARKLDTQARTAAAAQDPAEASRLLRIAAHLADRAAEWAREAAGIVNSQRENTATSRVEAK